MDNEPENHTLALLREIRAKQDGMNDALNARMDRMNTELNARMDGMSARMDGFPTTQEVRAAIAYQTESIVGHFDKRFDLIDKRFDSVNEGLELLRAQIALDHAAVVSNRASIDDHEMRIARLEDDTSGGSELDRPTTEPH